MFRFRSLKCCWKRNNICSSLLGYRQGLGTCLGKEAGGGKRVIHYCMRHYAANRYDLLVIGGGSGGLACAKEAAAFNKKVVVLDYVEPSAQGSKWGLGGTCVNVGCIPKKLMHRAALLGEAVSDAKAYGWQLPNTACHSWDRLCVAISDHIKSLNWGHRVQLKDKNVEYLNARGSFLDSNTICAVMVNKTEKILISSNIVVAVGGRPRLPHGLVGSKEHCITSDDIFTLTRPPGKTLMVGGSYVALECAGFLTGLGYDTTVMVRSVPLRGFDQQMAKLVTEYMQQCGTKFLSQCTPISVEKVDLTELKVCWKRSDGETSSDVFNTVLLATGRGAQTEQLHLPKAGVDFHPKSGKIFVDANDETNVSGIFAIGDVVHDHPELTPVAVQAGKLLARRLFGDTKELMHYENVPTTVFTPLEYGCVGLTEEEAIRKYGVDNIEVFHAFYKPLEYTVAKREASQCYIKIICDQTVNENVHGLHFIGPNAGEVIQGFAAAMMCGLTKKHLDSVIAIHPTCAEEVVKLHITKRSGADATVTGC